MVVWALMFHCVVVPNASYACFRPVAHCDLKFRNYFFERDLLFLERFGDEVVARNFPKHFLCTQIESALNKVGATVMVEWVGGSTCDIECMFIELA